MRPTESRVREALFSIWADRLAGARFLDLFCGSGSVGLDALSRGAKEVWLADGSKKAMRLLAANSAATAPNGWTVVRARLPAEIGRVARESDGGFDLVFADPPYEFDRYSDLLAASEALLSPAAEIAIEHSARRPLVESAGSLELCRRRSYGETTLSFYRGAPAQGASA